MTYTERLEYAMAAEQTDPVIFPHRRVTGRSHHGPQYDAIKVEWHVIQSPEQAAAHGDSPADSVDWAACRTVRFSEADFPRRSKSTKAQKLCTKCLTAASGRITPTEVEDRALALVKEAQLGVKGH